MNPHRNSTSALLTQVSCKLGVTSDVFGANPPSWLFLGTQGVLGQRQGVLGSFMVAVAKRLERVAPVSLGVPLLFPEAPGAWKGASSKDLVLAAVRKGLQRG